MCKSNEQHDSGQKSSILLKLIIFTTPCNNYETSNCYKSLNF
jgi:hypothetical protein